MVASDRSNGLYGRGRARFSAGYSCEYLRWESPVCRGARTVVGVIGRGTHGKRRDRGAEFSAGLQALVDEIPGLLEVRGRGLMMGVGVDPEIIDRAAVMTAARARELLITTAGPMPFASCRPSTSGRPWLGP